MALDFYNKKRVLVTGHTGFKGTWLAKILVNAGATVIGYSLNPPTNPNLFSLSKIETDIISIHGDVRDYEKFKKTIEKYKPEIIFHLAAQPLVKEAYKNPIYTYETNILGTLYLMEIMREYDFIKSVINVTTDKVYENKEWEWGYRENETLNGFDPYSNSKSCSELITQTYKRSFLDQAGIAVSTVRAGNVIGGGDFSENRIVPDCIQAALDKKIILVRNPYSTRPYQHVLESLSAYLIIAEKQFSNINLSNSYNVGPDDKDCLTTKELVEIFCEIYGNGMNWKDISNSNEPHEAKFLKLDCSRIKTTIRWKPIWNIKEAISRTVEWTKVYEQNIDLIPFIMDQQILDYFGGDKE